MRTLVEFTRIVLALMYEIVDWARIVLALPWVMLAVVFLGISEVLGGIHKICGHISLVIMGDD